MLSFWVIVFTAVSLTNSLPRVSDDLNLESANNQDRSTGIQIAQDIEVNPDDLTLSKDIFGAEADPSRTEISAETDTSGYLIAGCTANAPMDNVSDEDTPILRRGDFCPPAVRY